MRMGGLTAIGIWAAYDLLIDEPGPCASCGKQLGGRDGCVVVGTGDENFRVRACNRCGPKYKTVRALAGTLYEWPDHWLKRVDFTESDDPEEDA